MSFSAEHVSLAGIVIAALFAVYGVFRYRGGGSRLDLLLSLLIALGVVLVSVVPQIFEPASRLLGLKNRAFALLGLANLLLFALFLNMLGRVREAGRRSGEIVTGLAAREYSEKYLSDEEKAEGHPGEVLIVVPAYDEEGGIRGVLRRIPDEVLGHEVKTVVVDDGSRDATATVARAEGVAVVSHVVNRGQGDALRTGFAIALAEKAQVVVNLDADGQYKPEELDRLVKPIVEGRADFVLGSRFMGYYQEAGSIRHVGVIFFSRMISLLTGVRVSDCTNGYRAIRVSELHKLNLREDRFNANEIILEALKHKLRFEQVPVSMMSRAAGETKKPPKLAYPLGVFRVIISTWLR
ncbi:MAG: glycosyltransferase family 2 protein [Actinomycetota bacterium]|nr:glycosyltransferase family 2 protein [Actinomycetota bacterium]